MKGPALLLLALAGLSSCASVPHSDSQDVFFARLSALCGQAFEGRVTSPAVEADQDFAGRRLVMRVRTCAEREIRIPFQVGEDRSRTWVIARARGNGRGGGLSLKHDHRHADGSEDRLSGYGGVTVSPGSASRQEFPADTFSRDLFVRENSPRSVANVWAMEVHPGRIFAYELRRPGRFFRVEFDLARPLPPPIAGDRP